MLLTICLVGRRGSIIITVTPVYLGKSGVNVCLDCRNVDAKEVPVATFGDVSGPFLDERLVWLADPNLM